MAVERIKFDKPYRNVDSSVLTSNLDLIQDGYLDKLFNFYKRPGFVELCDLGTNKKIDGLFWSHKLQNIFAVSGGEVWKITSKDGSKTNLTGVSLIDGNRVSIDEAAKDSDTYVFMANGGQIAYTNGITPTAFISSTGSRSAPSQVTHLTYFDTYLIVAEGRSFGFSNPNDPFKWDSGDSYQAEMMIDDITALYQANRRIYIFGPQSVETWYNSGTVGSPFLRRLSGGYIEKGLQAPYAIDVSDGVLTFLDKDRRIISVEDDSFKIISEGYEKDIQSLNNVSDANAFRVKINGRNLFIVNFPQELKTFVYDYELDTWYNWGYYTPESGIYDIFKGGCYAYAKDWNMHIIGDNTTGKLYSFSQNIKNDNGREIRSFFRTGHVNYGVDSILKECVKLKCRVKRGVGKSSNPYAAPSMLVRKRDNGSLIWGNWKKVDLGKIGDSKSIRTIYNGNGGKYFSRQYEFLMPDDSDFVLSELSEKINPIEV